MREIMSHTAGFRYGLQDEHPVDKLYRSKQVLGATGLHQMIERTAEIPLMYQPGTSWRYSSAVDIQGYIVEKLSGQKFSDFLRERVFVPLKMKDTAFYVPADKARRLAAVYVGNKDTGKIEEAIDYLRQALRLNPMRNAWIWHKMGLAQITARRPAEALEAFRKVTPPLPFDDIYVAICLAKLDRVSEARALARRVLMARPGINVKGWATREPYYEKADLEDFLDGMRLAGFPEQ